MADSENYDARAVANLMLEVAWEKKIEITNLKLQKLLFLCHAVFLIQKGGKNLIKGNFEAWQYGPVHPEVYNAFKNFVAKPITEHAKKHNPITGELSEFDFPNDSDVRSTITNVLNVYGLKSANELIELTHKKDGPWDYVNKMSSSHANLGLRIDNSVIKERYKYLWFGKDQNTLNGENPDVEKPHSSSD
ncbi:MAG: DUF4065 domain-containing protein [Candidatus Symbiobacter sp.]|nr:DUF4065 domain-containing protein [Candidatus Symbiobacter sp.]